METGHSHGGSARLGPPHSLSLTTPSQGRTLGPHQSCQASGEQGEGTKQPLAPQQPLQLWVRSLASKPGYVLSTSPA